MYFLFLRAVVNIPIQILIILHDSYFARWSSHSWSLGHLWSIAASSSWRSPVIAVKQASENTSAALRVKKLELPLISFLMRWVEGRIGHCSRVLRRCHHERSSCSGEFGFRSFIKQSPSAVCVPLVMWKKCVFLRAQFGWRSLNISLSDSVLETKKTLGKSIKFDLPN